MPELPLYPDRGREAPGHALEKRRRGLSGVSTDAWRRARLVLRAECAMETLGLTGAPVSRDVALRLSEAGSGGVSEDEKLVLGVLEGLDAIERVAKDRPEPNVALIQQVHRFANPQSDGSLRTDELTPQFQGARPSPPRFVRSKLDNLLEWLGAESCRTMFPAERMALWFARFVEISPFPRGNFRTGHLFASHFALAAGFPPVTLRLEDADAIRSDMERAVRFDTLPLVQRFSESLDRAVSTVESFAQPSREGE